MAKKKPYRFFLYLLLEFTVLLFRILPRFAAQAIGAGFGILTFWILPHQRRKAVDHLRQAFGNEKSEAEIWQLAKNVFCNLGKTGADILQLSKSSCSYLESFVKVETGALEKLRKISDAGNGIILLTAHIGNWESLGAYVCHFGFIGCALGKRLYYEPFNRILVGLRKKGNVGTIYHDEPRAVLKFLKLGNMVGILADQDIDRIDGIFVPFFGKPTWTPVAPARIALTSRAAIAPAFMIREGDHYRLYVEDPIPFPENASKDEAMKIMTLKWSQVVECYIRRFPDQWAWIHPRWRTTPEQKEKQERERAMN